MVNSEKIKSFYKNLNPATEKLPDNIEWINPFENEQTVKAQSKFYEKFYADNQKRLFLFGINPGRFGAGITGIPFTDPIFLEDVCGIENKFEKKHELSSKFIYQVVERFAGPAVFFKKVYISAVCPLGFTKNGLNINYYDNKTLQRQLWDFMKNEIKKQLSFSKREVAFSIGAGKNLQVLTKMNEEENWFERVEALPHPRWVMQYKLKFKEVFIEEYYNKIEKATIEG